METAWHGKDMAKTGTSPALRLGQENGMARQASSVEQSKNRGGMQTEGPPFFPRGANGSVPGRRSSTKKVAAHGSRRSAPASPLHSPWHRSRREHRAEA